MTPSPTHPTPPAMTDTDPSEIFSRPINLDTHQIRRPLYFYVGLNKFGRVPIERLIREHGGEVVSDIKKGQSRVMYLIDPLSKPSLNGPQVYSVHFVHDCIKAGKLLDIEHFRIPHRYERVSIAKETSLNTPRAKECNRVNGKQSPQTRSRRTSLSHPAAGTKTENAYESRHRNRPLSARRAPPQLHPVSDDDEQPQQNQVETISGRAAKHRAVKLTEKQDKDSKVVVEETSPSLAPDNWTPDEDEKLIRICDALQNSLQKRKKDLNYMFILDTWKAFMKSKSLPPDRTIEECRERAIHLRILKHETSEPSVHKEKKKRKSVRRWYDDISDDEIRPANLEQRAAKTRRVSEPKALAKHKSEEKRTAHDEVRIVQRKDVIRRMVRSLSYETQMTQRRVFQVLRANSGDRARTKEALVKERANSGKAGRLSRSKR
ncbi:unnamed protein product [Agarophyton chilense]